MTYQCNFSILSHIGYQIRSAGPLSANINSNSGIIHKKHSQILVGRESQLEIVSLKLKQLLSHNQGKAAHE